MKTPDEIKKGLECCAGVGRCRSECPYYASNNTLACTNKKSMDALSYIRQLERERDALQAALKAIDPCDNCKYCGTAWGCDGDCSFCDHSETCQCRECDGDSHWEWVGIKEEYK